VQSDKSRVRSYGRETKLRAMKVEASTITAGRAETQSEISESGRKRQVSSLEQSRNGAELGTECRAICNRYHGRKVSACRAICRPSRSVKRQDWSNPNAVRGAKSRARSNPRTAARTKDREGSNPGPVRSSQVLYTEQSEYTRRKVWKVEQSTNCTRR